jgi:hypothetical protein
MAAATVDDEDLFDRALKTYGQSKTTDSEDIFDRALKTLKPAKATESRVAMPTTVPTKEGTVKRPKTDAKQEGIKDLEQVVFQLEGSLADTKPGTETHKRISASLAEAKKELSRYQLQPAAAAPAAGPAAPAAAVAPAESKPAPAAQPKVADIGTRILRSGAGLADTILGGIQALPGMAVAETGYAGVRAGEALGLVEPGRAERGRAAVYKKFVEPYTQPIGGMLGATETPEYKSEASQRIMQFIGENISKGADWLSQKTGIPKADIENMIATGAFAIPGAVKAVGAEARMVAGAAKGEAKPPAVKMEPTLEKPRMTYEEFKAQQQKRKPSAPTEEGLGTAKPTAPDAPFSELKYGEIGVPVEEQAARAQTLSRVMGPDFRVDTAAIKGHGKDRATKYAVSNTDTPMGNFLKEQFTNEQNRLSNYINEKIKETGGTVGLDESSVYKRGNTILQPLKDLQTYFDDATRKIYADRDAIAKDVPVQANNILNVLRDESLTLANTETIGLTKIVEARMKQLGMVDKNGNLLPTNAKTAENLRKFINENWDRKNNNLHKALKSAVDEDVIANLDTTSPLYKDARALVELRKNTLDNPKGISNILDAEGPKGINRKVQIEKIAQNIADMPVDQFTHVIDTLRNVPQQLQPQATKAISEIKAQFANRIAEQKTPAQLTKYMNDNREVMTRLFSEKEINGLRDYHNAKHILATDTGYKGAAVQKINVEKKLGTKIAEQALHKGGAVVAGGGAEGLTLGTTGGVAGSAATMAAYELIGSRLAKKQAQRQAQAEAAALRSEEQKFVPLSDLLPRNK